MFKNYKEETLNSLGIYELRELARKVGVASPTTKKREELEHEIIEINNGSLAPVKSSNRGRPPKTISNVEKYLDIFVPKEFIETSLKTKADEKLFASLKFNKKTELEKTLHNFKGYLRKTVSGYYYFRDVDDFNRVVSVPDLIVNEYNLYEGDLLSGMARKMTSMDYYLLTELHLVNFDEAKKERCLVEVDKLVLDEVPLNSNLDFNFGSKVLFVDENFKQGLLKLKELTLPLQDEYTLIFLCVNTSIYNKLSLTKDFNGEFLSSYMNDHPQTHYETITNAINHVNILMREGKKVALVIFDLMGLLKSVEDFFSLENNQTGFQENFEAERLVKKLFNLARVLSNYGGCTIFANCLKIEKEHEFYKKDLIKDADYIIEN